MHLIYPTFIYKWDIHNLYSYTRPIRAMHDLYKSALALCILFYFLRLLYICSSPYLTRDTHYRLINIYYFWGTIVCYIFGLPGYTNSFVRMSANCFILRICSICNLFLCTILFCIYKYLILICFALL
jgi:hypothetical protein